MQDLTTNEYRYLVGRISVDKLPPYVMIKLSQGDDFTEDEVKELRPLIHEHAKKAGIDIDEHYKHNEI